MRKSSASIRKAGAYTSPGTPDYRDNSMGGIQKGWCSERVPLPNNASRRHISATALMPFNSGRTLPSKWDDAERWITSPLSGFSICKTLPAPPQRRPKSKSGPLGGNPGGAYFSNYSPVVPVLESGSSNGFVAASPLTTGVMAAEGLSIHYDSGINVHSSTTYMEYGVTLSSSIPGWSDLLIESSCPSSQDEMPDSTKDVENRISPVVSRRDMATQMSPVCSRSSSRKRTSPPWAPQALDPRNQSSKVEVRDVQVDKGATIRRHSKRHGARATKNEDLGLAWDNSGAARTSKLQKEEARITAWENLQNAKAEAAIRKLEMRLERKRSASMDKILNKLRVAQMKAQDMRRSISESPTNQASMGSPKIVCLHKFVKMRYLNGCFICRQS